MPKNSSRAFSTAAALIDAMDLESFWGEDTFMSEDDAQLTSEKQAVVDHLHAVARGSKRKRKQ